MHKTRLPAWLILTLIALLAAALLGVTYEMTKDTIAAQEVEKAAATRRALLPDAADFVQLECDEALASLYVGNDANGEAVGYVATTTVTGFGGPVEIIVGMDNDGVLTGISVGGTEFSETPGLGAKAKDAAFTDQFAGLSTPVKLGEGVDAITSATITSNAVVRGVNDASSVVGQIAGFATSTPAVVGETAEGRFYSEVQGFAGPVYVEIALDDNGAISEIIIGNDSFSETAGYGKRAQEPAFYEQFIGLSGTLELGTDVDALSGATITSTAVTKAVNQALAFSRGETVEAEPVDTTASATSGATSSAPSASAVPVVYAAGELDNGRYYAEVKGFAGPVYVEIAVDENGAVTAITIGDDRFAETDGFGKKAQEPAFYEQFIGKSGTLTLGEDVDAITMATITSTAVTDAVNAALAFSRGETVEITPVDTASSATGTADTTTSATGTTEEADTASSATGAADTTASATGTTDTAESVLPTAGKLENGNYYAEYKGFAGPVYVELTLDENGAISAITIGDERFAETDGFGKKAQEPAFYEQFIGKSGTLTLGTDVDAITMATITSTAVTDAVNAALAFSRGETVEITPVDTASSATGTADTTASATGTTEEADTASSATGTADTTTSATGTTEEADTASSATGAADTTASATGTTDTAESVLPTAGKLENGNYYAEYKGFAGPVYVELTLDENGAISAITIGDERFAETDGFGKKAQEPAFYEQFIGLSGSVALGEDVDAITMATITSTAVTDAVNLALEEAAK